MIMMERNNMADIDPSYAYNKNRMYIRQQLSEEARYEQLAEEAAELAQAALKVARIMRGENPTPMSIEEARKNLVEEYSDVTVAANVLNLCTDSDVMVEKMERWKNRIPKVTVAINEKESPYVYDRPVIQN